jgi:hypothetical protein
MVVERALLDYNKDKYAAAAERINTAKDLTKQDEATLHEAADEFEKDRTY